MSTGNHALHWLTWSKRYQLRIDLEDFRGNKRYAKYSEFKIGSSGYKYKLVNLGSYSGSAGIGPSIAIVSECLRKHHLDTL